MKAKRMHAFQTSCHTNAAYRTATIAVMLMLLATGAVNAEDDKLIVASDPKLGRPVEFDRDVYPILEAKCVACHNQANNESDLILEDAASILKGGASGPAVVAGKPEESMLLLVSSRQDEPVMPPLPNDVKATALTGKQVGILKQWIAEGAKAGSGQAKQLAWQPLPSHLNAIYAAALDPWGRYAVVGRANRITVYDLFNGTEAGRLADPTLLAIKQAAGPMYGPTTAHRDFVHSVAFSPDGKTIASGGYRVIKLWQKSQIAPHHSIKPGQPITTSATSADWTALGLADHSVRIFKTSDATPGVTFTGHSAAVRAIAFSHDGTQLVTGSDDKTVRLWSVADGRQLASVETPGAVNAVAITQAAKFVFSASGENVIRKWSVPAKPADTKLVAAGELKGPGKPITALAAMRGAKPANQIVSASTDGNAQLWDTNSNKQIRTFGLGSPATAVAVQPDGARIAVAGDGGVTKVFTTKDGKLVFELKTDPAADRKVTTTTVLKTIADQRVAIADAAVKATEKDIQSRTEAVKKATESKDKAVKAVADPEKKNTEAVAALKKSEEALKAKPEDAGLKKKVESDKKNAATAAGKLKGAKDAVDAAERGIKLANDAVARSKKRLDEQNAVKAAEVKLQADAVAKLKTSQDVQKKPLSAIQSLAFSPSGTMLATSDSDKNIRTWNSVSGKSIESFVAVSPVSQTAFTTDDRLLTTSTSDTATTWGLKSEWRLVATLGPHDAQTPTDVRQSVLMDRVLSLSFSHDGQQLVSGGGEASRSGELIIWDVKTRKPVQQFADPHSDTIFATEFSADDQFLVSGAADKFVKVFSVKTGEHVRSYEGHTHHVMDVSWKADGATLASAGADNVMKVWNVETGEQRRTITSHQKQVTSIQFVGTGDQVVSSSGDKSVRIHTTSNGKNVRTLSGATDYVFSVASLSDLSVVIGAGQDGVLRVWDGRDGKLINSFAPPEIPVENTQANAAK